MSPSLASERATVQDPLIGYAVEIGWSYLSPEQALTLRRGQSGPLLYPILGDKLGLLSAVSVTLGNVNQIALKEYPIEVT